MGFHLDKKLIVRKRQAGVDGMGTLLEGYDDGKSLQCGFATLSDSERFQSGRQGAVSMARFVVKYNSYSAAIGHDDRLWFKGQEWAIDGFKTLGRNRWIEITAVLEA